MKILKNIIQNIGNKENFTFVSVGANNGIFVDEVFQSKLLNINWNCYFIEPVKETFELLVKNYSEHYPNNQFVYDNCAIHINEGEDYLVTNKVDAKQTNLVDEVLSEADTEPGNPLSKSKLKAMSVDKLKSICTHHHLSVEGSKSVLISRILGEIRD